MFAAHGSEVLIVPLDGADEPEAATLAGRLRAAGLSVELDVRLRGVRAGLRHADRQRIPFVVICGQRERERGRPVLRDMRTREEVDFDRAELAAAVRGRL